MREPLPSKLGCPSIEQMNIFRIFGNRATCERREETGTEKKSG